MRIIVFIAAILLLFYACRNNTGVVSDSDTYYTCSMDPQVKEFKPGKCPICKMQLTQVKKNNGEKKDELQLSAQQIQLGNIQTDTIGNGSISDQLVLTATLNFDEGKSTSVSSRVTGRIERLYYKNIGDYVRKGSPIYDLYSEELNNAKQEYLLALERQKTFADETAIDFNQLLLGAKNKLLLWGMTENQVRQLANEKKSSPTTTFYSTASGYITELKILEGDYIMEGGTIVRLADLSSLWAEAQVYTSQLSKVNRNSIVTVSLPDFDGKEIKGRLDFVNPEINTDTRINLVRVSIPNPGNLLKPGMPAYVLLKSPQRKMLALPIDAVIRDGKGSSVWIQIADKTFKTVMVATGLESDNVIEIKSGLKAGDIVVVSGAYLLNSEFIFKKGSDPMAAHQH